MVQDTAKVSTNLQMKTAEQAHGHAMEAAKVGNKHTQTMAKIAPQSVAAQPAAGGPPAAGPPAASAPAADSKKTSKRFATPDEMRQAMHEAMADGFVFVTAINDGGATSYRYLKPDHSELLLTFAPAEN
jgi:hypothetical protein